MISVSRHGAVAAEDDVQRHDGDRVPLDQLGREVGRAVGDHRDVGHAGGSLLCRRPNLAPLGQGPRHRRDRLHRLPRRPAARRARRRAACWACEEGSPDPAIAGLDAERVRLEVRDRRRCAARCGASSGSSTAPGVTSVRPEDAERLFEVNVGGTKLVIEECLRAGVERVVYTSSAAAVGPGAGGQDGRRDAAVHRRPARHPLRQLRARGRGRGDAGRRPRACRSCA